MTNKTHIIIMKGRDYMSFFDGFLINTIFILFPLLVYLIYVAYCNNIDKDYSDIFFQLALFTSLYLVMRHGYSGPNSYILLLINIPLVFAFLNKKTSIAILISILLIVFCTIAMNYNFYIVLIEYILYFLAYLYGLKNKKEEYYIINIFTIIKAFFLSFLTFYITKSNNNIINDFKNIIVNVVVFYSAINIYLLLIRKAEQIIDLNSSIKEIEKEKSVQASLFKITHEIKNPIAVCKGYLDMLDTNNTKKVEQYIPIIKSEIDRTLILMDDFLQYSKLNINKEILDINMLIEDTCHSMMPLFKEYKVKTNFSITDDEIYIMGDYNKLKQVLINIFKNSFESKRKNKKLYIKLKTDIINNTVNIIVMDNGCGMTEEQLNKIGEAFFTTKESGTGLGVCLSQKIIKQHDGSILYESNVNEGTKVTIVLPLYKFS